jgi:hypothetical protein
MLGRDFFQIASAIILRDYRLRKISETRLKESKMKTLTMTIIVLVVSAGAGWTEPLTSGARNYDDAYMQAPPSNGQSLAQRRAQWLKRTYAPSKIR